MTLPLSYSRSRSGPLYSTAPQIRFALEIRTSSTMTRSSILLATILCGGTAVRPRYVDRVSRLFSGAGRYHWRETSRGAGSAGRSASLAILRCSSSSSLRTPKAASRWSGAMGPIPRALFGSPAPGLHVLGYLQQSQRGGTHGGEVQSVSERRRARRDPRCQDARFASASLAARRASCSWGRARRTTASSASRLSLSRSAVPSPCAGRRFLCG